MSETSNDTQSSQKTYPSRLDEIQDKSKELYAFLMEIRQRFGGGTIKKLEWKNGN